ncbi:MAG: 4Fe-4S binding protein [Coriobacteriales bacterium]|jgi:NAD-dependent dihydropyrimidine dehydrogenase PreA subunit
MARTIDMSRRGFLGTMGAMGVVGTMGAMGMGLAPSVSLAGNGIDPQGVDLPWGGANSADGSWTGTPDDVKAKGGCTMPLEELNRRRHLYVDSQTEYTCSDGKTIPECYVKARALLHTYGFGIGNEKTDTCFDWFMSEMSEDEAKAYIDMPYGRLFTSQEWAEESGRDVDECETICDGLFSKAWLGRIVNDNGVQYYHIAWIQGVGEYHTPDYYDGRTDLAAAGTIATSDALKSGFEAGMPFFASVPCRPEVVKDGAIYPVDDVRKIWASKRKFSLSPCYCRSMDAFSAGQKVDLPGYPDLDGNYDIADVTSPLCGHDMETCLSCGEEAQFWIDHGVGREITYEEAMERLEKSVDEGMIINHTCSVRSETICSCDGDCCLDLAIWKQVGSGSRAWQQSSHYTLEVDTDACIKCGACVERCPMDMVTLDEKTGYPTVGDLCMRCGQCVLTCPAGARILVPRPQDEFMLYEDIIEQNNMIAADRFENGYIW